MLRNLPAPPKSLVSVDPAGWLRVFGPGAIIASLTIGTGELIFSSRGGALFGYRVLFLFVVICLAKWVLVYSTARHMVVSGIHPFQRWMELPGGPRGWLPLILWLMAAICIPVWVSFHASVLGDLVATTTGTKKWWNGASVHVWGGLILTSIVLLALRGGYRSLERVQLAIVAAMLAAMCVSLVLLEPNWWELLAGFVVPRTLSYPSWLADDPSAAVRQIAERPEWVEATLYVGVIGGAGYDYLAYTSFLRDKGWGMAGLCSGALPAEEGTLWHERYTILRQWMRAPLIDCTVSFLVVLLFSGVFVASGAIVLGPRHQLPSNEGFLEHQAQFVTQLHPWLYPLYVVGVLLTMLGTLYGTLEVAPTIMREFMIALSDKRHCTSGTSTHGTGAQRSAGDRYRKSAILWSGGGACLVLAISFWHQLRGADGRPPGLEQLLIPANLFTGVLLCGIVCLTNPWCDRKLPAALRLPIVMVLLNLAAGVAFVTLSVWSAWSSNGWFAVAILAGTVMVGYVIATLLALRLREPHPAPKREGNER